MLRRDALRLLGGAMASLVAGSAISSAPASPSLLWLQRGNEAYRFDIRTREGLATANWMLRDVRGGDRVGASPRAVISEMAWMQAWIAAYGWHRPFMVHSGLRMPWTNAKTEGAARASLHLPANLPTGDMRFGAVDISMPDIVATTLARLAAHARMGGVLLYADQGFIHLDEGPVRLVTMPSKNTRR